MSDEAATATPNPQATETKTTDAAAKTPTPEAAPKTKNPIDLTEEPTDRGLRELLSLLPVLRQLPDRINAVEAEISHKVAQEAEKILDAVRAK